ncbi:MAG: formylglycine-generating enzyme family protein [Hyphomicrobiales bacterium]
MKKYYILSIIILCLAYSCKKDDKQNTPSKENINTIIYTDEIDLKVYYYLLDDSAFTVSAVVKLDTSMIQKFGFCYGTEADNISDTIYSRKLNDSKFISIINTVKPSTEYYVRALVFTEDKLYVSKDVENFTTIEPSCPPIMPKEIGLEMQYVKSGVSFHKINGEELVCDAAVHRHYYISTKEVTIRQYLIFLNAINANPNGIVNNREYIDMADELCPVEYKEGKFCFKQTQIASSEDMPITCVTLLGSMAFTEWLTEVTKCKYELPTCRQWTYVAHGGAYSKGYQFAGSNDINDVAWYKNNSGGKLHKGGLKLPNELGLYDMVGNVAEWCREDGHWLVEVVFYNQCMYIKGSSYSDYKDLDAIFCNMVTPVNFHNHGWGFRVIYDPRYKVDESERENSKLDEESLDIRRLFQEQELSK